MSSHNDTSRTVELTTPITSFHLSHADPHQQPSGTTPAHMTPPYYDPKNDVSLTLVYDKVSVSFDIYATPPPSVPTTPTDTDNVLSPPLPASISNPDPVDPNPILAPFVDLYNRGRYYLLQDTTVKSEFHRIHNASGTLLPGTTTLILSPPGGGRGTLLKVLSDQISISSGVLMFNGLTIDEASSSESCDVKKMLRFVDQTDAHFDMMTVREILSFAYNVSVNTDNIRNDYVDNLIAAFDMTECSNTLFGSCSGGQKKRVSVMVGLCNPSVKVLCYKQPTDGLDSAVADRLIAYLKRWARLNNAAVVIAMQQPSPSIFDSFDNIIVLKDGNMLYNGPNADVMNYFTAMGYPCPDDVELSSHILQVITYPKQVLQQYELSKPSSSLIDHNAHKIDDTNDQAVHPHSNPSRLCIKIPSSNSSPFPRAPIQTTYGDLYPSICPAITLEEMLSFYYASPMYAYIRETIEHVHELRAKMGLKNRNIADDDKDVESVISRSAPRVRMNNKSPPPSPGGDGTNSQLGGEPHEDMDKTQDKQLDYPNSPWYAGSTLQTRTTAAGRALSTHEAIYAAHTDYLMQIKPNCYHVSELIQTKYSKGFDALITPGTRQYYAMGYSNSIFDLIKSVLTRQITLTYRNSSLIISRLIPALTQSVLFSGMYFQIPLDDYVSRCGCIADINTELAYNNFIELQLVITNKQIIHSQQALYPMWIYTMAVQLCTIPFAVVEAFILTIIPYLMIGHTLNALNFFSFWVLLLFHGMTMSAFFRAVGAASPNASIAYAIAMPVACVLYFCNGFYVKLSTIPVWLSWVIYISPFTWALRSLALVEFTSSRYDFLIQSPFNPSELIKAGEAYLRLNHIYTDPLWVIYSLIYCIGVVVLFVLFSAWLLYDPTREYTAGTTRWSKQGDESIEIRYEYDVNPAPLIECHNGQLIAQAAETSMVEDGFSDDEEPSLPPEKEISHELHTLTNELSFTPSTLSFHALSFTVDAVDEKTGKPYKRKLLQNVDGLAEPGVSLALCGGSGAGKSTLLNTLYGLNTTTATSTVEGSIYVNGKQLTPNEFAAIAGYVEQFASLPACETVYEALYFSAKMKLVGTPEETLCKVVEEVMGVLELTHCRNTLCGSPENPSLSPSQAKRVSIGVVLVQNPAILFLDEPTTGLDAQAAAIVVRTIARIARSGRATITTIHQPDAQLFFAFDALLLLGSGGYQLFSSHLGYRSRQMIDYFQSIPCVTKLPARINPAEWMVEQVSQTLPANLYPIAEQMYNEFYTANSHRAPPIIMSSEIHSERICQTQVFTPFKDLSPKQQYVQYLHIFWLTSPLWCKFRTYFSKVNPSVVFLDVDTVHPQHHHGHKQLEQLITVDTSDANPSVDILQKAALNTTKIMEQTESNNGVENKHIPLHQQFIELTKRMWHVYTRDAYLFYTRLISISVLSLFFTCIYSGFDVKDFNSFLTFHSATVLATGNICFIFTMTSLPLIYEMRSLLYREQQSQLYTPIFWPISILLCEMTMLVPMSWICFVFHYFSMGGATTAKAILLYWFINYFFSIFWLNFGCMLTMIAPNAAVAEIVQNITASISFVFAGVAIPITKVNKIYNVLMRILPLYYFNRMLVMSQFEDNHTIVEIFENNTSYTTTLRDFAADWVGYTYDQFGWSVLWLSIMATVVFIVSILGSIFCRWK